jgi:hypothetical protein
LHNTFFCFVHFIPTNIIYLGKNIFKLKRSFSEIPTRFLTPYREFEQRPHTPHWRQLDSNSRYGVRKYSRVTSTLVTVVNVKVLVVKWHFLNNVTLTKMSLRVPVKI